ncbi:MAG: ABC transporter ATP-binding protein [Thermoleophilia bacterium]
MTTPAIATEGLTKYYGSVRGVEALDLVVQQGEVFGFLGPNGAGKTTTLRLLLDLIRPDAGCARILGKDVRAEREAVHREIGYLPGELAMWPELTGGENLEYLARLRGGVDRAYLAALLERFEVDPGRRFREYSRGNKQKIGLVQAFMHRPRLLLLDEPTSGLDPLVQNTFHELIAEVVAEGRTVFLSSHVLSEVERMCDRAGIIREGRLVRVDRVAALGMGTVHLVRMTFAGPIDAAEFASLPGVRGLESSPESLATGAGRQAAILSATVSGDPRPLLAASLRHELLEIESRRPSLEELFLTYYNDDPAPEHA